MYRVAIWGTGGTYYEYAKLLDLYEQLKQIKIDCFINNDIQEESEFHSYKLLPAQMFLDEDEKNVDYIIIASIHFDEIVMQLSRRGCREKIIPIELLKLPFFDFEKYIRIRNNKCSIVSENCIGGILSHQLGLKFYSPFVNMSITSEDYFKLINRLDYYIANSPMFTASEQYPYAELKFWKNRPEGWEAYLWYDDIAIRGVHYPNQESFFEAFERRRKRFDIDNRFILKILYDEDDVIEFRKIKERKLGFYYKKCPDQDIAWVPLEKDMSQFDYKYNQLINRLFLSGKIHRYVDFFSVL